MTVMDKQAVVYLHSNVDRMSVTLTYAQSLDGCIGTRTGKPLVLSGRESFRVTHTLRRYHDYILVGAGTCASDDPGLNARDGHNNAVDLAYQPIPVFVDLQGRCQLTKDAKVCKLARKGQGLPALRLVHRALFEARHRRLSADVNMEAACCGLEAGGVKTIFLDAATIKVDEAGHASCSWDDIIACLRALDPKKQSIMIEGGAGVIRSVLAERAASLVIVTVAPSYIGENGVSLGLTEAIGLMGVKTAVFGRDTVMSGVLRS
ncbi:dihydrofolate reductase-like domain-containing protein [Protomyces lactucae-debilis]|uniref:2,5-diamino-6-ribosylamino-4(3H)-pyrimidinone 5'-phosphate reductase n=1 Tax=Protomyces lactucae-debilis TaxID=2754530 RepID=A0A1Y2FQM2_PROLT|nr:dihydrofolate reductase-like domain-containing protein [Protomyces lactucae-debilis]ORY86302.1 dihydrofolate reductase-like domain-containing protein [Protomyces lactucae-debilis]